MKLNRFSASQRLEQKKAYDSLGGWHFLDVHPLDVCIYVHM